MMMKRMVNRGYIRVLLIVISFLSICYVNKYSKQSQNLNEISFTMKQNNQNSRLKLFSERLKTQVVFLGKQMKSKRRRPKIELTLRVTLRNDLLELILCDFLRSTVLFWSADYGDVVFILDERDKKKNFENKLNSLGLPNKFRCAYEKDLYDRNLVENRTKEAERPGGYGKMRTAYSSFIMDIYTDEETIIAWTDSDTVFTIPVTEKSIFRNGKLIVKGNYLPDYHLFDKWRKTTLFALGLPMVSDFMSYFPAYVYAHTIKNCRQHIMKHLNTTTFEEAFVKMTEYDVYFSPIVIVFSYAYYFEKDLYDWHLDIRHESLESYNKKMLPPKYPLLASDITPELHVTIHSKYYTPDIRPIEQAICYSQIYLGMRNIPHCDLFRNNTNLQLFMFQYGKSHLFSWCEPGPKREHCKKLIDDRYKNWAKRYHKSKLQYNTSYIKVIDEFANKQYGINCYNFEYAPYD